MSSTLKPFADPATRVFSFTVLISVMVHAFLILGVGFKLPDPSKLFNRAQLDIVLVNAHSKTAPAKASALAQANLDGGGNTDLLNQRISTPLPSDDISNASNQLVQESVRRQNLELQQQKLMSALKDAPKLSALEEQLKTSDTANGINTDDKQHASEIARLQGEIARDLHDQESRPHKAFVAGKSKVLAEARYIEDWRTRIERVGNLNFPIGANGKRLYGNLQVMVGIHADGSLAEVTIERSSGNKILDEAAKRIVRMSTPFSSLPKGIVDRDGKPADILYIVRAWTFSSTDNNLNQATND